jgi:hypothetical protein
MTDGYANRFTSFATEDRQWDARFNVQLESDLEQLLDGVKREFDSGKVKYALVGGVEIGTKEFQDDFGIKHVHCAFIYNNRVSKRSLLKNLNIKTGNGYYLVPRNRSLPYSGWKNHHTKEYSKVDTSKLVLCEMGTLPADRDIDGQNKFVKRSDDEKKRKVDEVLIDLRAMLENNQDEAAFKKYPRTFIQYGEKLKALIAQKSTNLTHNGDPHIWLYGGPGTGKSAILSYIYPNTFKKNLYNKFFDLYDPKIHTHIMLEDLDHDAVDKLSTNFIKTLCDESGFAIDQKYKTPQLTRSTILVTSNFTITSIIDGSEEANVFGKEENKKAIYRRFFHINANEFMHLCGVKILPKYELNQLKKKGNTDPKACFMSWNYTCDTPTGKPLEAPEYYQKLIKDAYFN